MLNLLRYFFNSLNYLCILGTFPIDTTKIRLQVQGQVANKSLSELKYRGMFHALLTITKEEGFTALFNGIKPALLRQATYGTVTITLKCLVYEPFIYPLQSMAKGSGIIEIRLHYSPPPALVLNLNLFYVVCVFQCQH